MTSYRSNTSTPKLTNTRSGWIGKHPFLRRCDGNTTMYCYNCNSFDEGGPSQQHLNITKRQHTKGEIFMTDK
jgi:hypothetical protein